MEATATITSKGQITIPKIIRDFFNLKAKDSLVFTISKKKIIAKPMEDDYKSLRGMFKVPAHLKGKSWKEIKSQAWKAIAENAAKEGLE